MKNELFKLIIEVFLNLVLLKKIYIWHNITNYQKIQEEYGEKWDDPPMMWFTFVLNKYDSRRFESIGRKRNYKNIF